jgi:23S rRNA pseudouridine1911/1915/1917 synthase
VHRLDKETSGCLVAAKTDLAHQRLAGQFERRAVRKIYLALVAGHFAKPDGIVEAPIGRHAVHRTKMAIVGPPRGRVARTTWRVLRELGDTSLLECTLHTGRTHQIRVHLAHLGHPVLGDPVYGKRGAFSRQMLHAWRLGFAHPRTGVWFDFESPIPLEFEQSGGTQP